MVVDSTDRERLDVVKKEFENVIKNEQLKNAVLLVFANKQDIKDSMGAAEISDKLGLSQLKSHQWHIQSSCALTGEGLSNGMDWLADHLKK